MGEFNHFKYTKTVIYLKEILVESSNKVRNLL